MTIQGESALSRAMRLVRLVTPLWLFISALLILSAAVGSRVPGLPSGTASPHVSWLILLVAFAAAEVLQVHLHFRGEAHTLTLSEVPLAVGLIFSSPNELLVAAVCGAGLVRLVWKRQVATKQAFNLALSLLEVSIAVLVFRAVAPIPDAGAWTTWLGVCLAVLVSVVMTTLLVAAVISVSERQFQVAIVGATMAPAMVVGAVNTALAFSISAVLVHNPLAVLALIAPTGASWLGYQAYTRQVDQRERLEFLLELERLVHAPGALDEQITASVALSREQLRARDLHIVALPPSPPDLLSPEVFPIATGALEVLARAGGSQDGMLVDVSGAEPAVQAAMHELSVRQALVVPLRVAGQVVGSVLALGRVGETARYEQAHLQVLRAACGQITNSLERAGLTRALTRLQHLQRELTHQALHDPLTGMGNRRYFTDAVTEILATERTANPAAALLLLDLDGFKAINDRHGHGVGDEVLRIVADRLRRSLRAGDLAARLGGDEFVVLVRGPLTEASVSDLGVRVLNAVSGPATVSGRPLDIRISLGIGLLTPEVLEIDVLLQRADLAMYDAKRTADGKPRVFGDETLARTALAGLDHPVAMDVGEVA